MALTREVSETDRAAWTAAGRWETAIRIYDVERGQTLHEFTLDGNFEVETISARGDALFLV